MFTQNIDGVDGVKTDTQFVAVTHRSASADWLSRTELTLHLAVFTSVRTRLITGRQIVRYRPLLFG